MGRSRLSRAAALAAALVVGGALVGRARAQLPEDAAPLANDAYVPVSAPALAALRRGDGECLRALEGGPGAELAWTRCFDAWREALEESATGDAVPVGLLLDESRPPAELERDRAVLLERWPDRDGSFGRRTEGVEVAVLRRLCGLDPERATTWSARFDSLASASLASAGATLELGARARRLAEVERLFPATRAGSTAALWSLELELEAGRSRAARAWLERGRLHAALAGAPAAELAQALERRAAPLDASRPTPRGAPPPWSRARQLLPREGHPLVRPGYAKSRGMARRTGQPGLAFLDDGRLAVQDDATVWILACEPGGPSEDRIFRPLKLAHELGQPISRKAEAAGREWPHFPRARGDELFLVCGRADLSSSNSVMRVSAPRDLELPELVWCLGGNGLDGPGGEHLPLGEVLEDGLWEFQPGPLLVGDRLLVQARRWSWTDDARFGRPVAHNPGEAESWLLALDTANGQPVWRRLLGRGPELVLHFGPRLGRPELVRAPASALEVAEGGVFVGTNLGSAFLLDLADGRLRWSFRCRRRPAAAPGWRTGARPDSGEELLLWAPADSNELYALGSRLDFAPRGLPQPPPVVSHPPLAIGEGELLLGGDPEQVLVLGRAGSRRTLSAHDLTSGRRYDSIYLEREEDWLPGALLSRRHLLFAGEAGLYLLDRQRELYLADYHALDLGSDFAAGGLWARGNWLYLLARGELLRFELL